MARAHHGRGSDGTSGGRGHQGRPTAPASTSWTAVMRRTSTVSRDGGSSRRRRAGPADGAVAPRCALRSSATSHAAATAERGGTLRSRPAPSPLVRTAAGCRRIASSSCRRARACADQPSSRHELRRPAVAAPQLGGPGVVPPQLRRPAPSVAVVRRGRPGGRRPRLAAVAQVLPALAGRAPRRARCRPSRRCALASAAAQAEPFHGWPKTSNSPVRTASPSPTCASPRAASSEPVPVPQLLAGAAGIGRQLEQLLVDLVQVGPAGTAHGRRRARAARRRCPAAAP